MGSFESIKKCEAIKGSDEKDRLMTYY